MGTAPDTMTTASGEPLPISGLGRRAGRSATPWRASPTALRAKPIRRRSPEGIEPFISSSWLAAEPRDSGSCFNRSPWAGTLKP